MIGRDVKYVRHIIRPTAALIADRASFLAFWHMAILSSKELGQANMANGNVTCFMSEGSPRRANIHLF